LNLILFLFLKNKKDKMKLRNIFLLILVCSSISISAQNVETTLKNAYSQFAKDSNFKHASIGLYVVNTATSAPLISINTQMGLAPASTQKTITAATSFALLDKTFTYQTTLSYSGKIVDGVLNGDIIIKGDGDPTLGSWRYSQSSEDNIIATFKKAISQAGITAITGHVISDETNWNSEVTPDGWIWQDLGSYYGAGARAINWHENQYDLLLKSGNKIQDSVTIVGYVPSFIAGLQLRSMVTSAGKGTGDNAYIYYPLNENYGYVRGTIPLGENRFKISGSMPHPALQLALTLEAALKNISLEDAANQYSGVINGNQTLTMFYTFQSPTLKDISFWFLNKSINLYGEALLKTLGEKFLKSGSTESGIKVIQDFWKKQGIEPYAINIQDGSGLSPANRITVQSLVQVLQYTKKQDWFGDYYKGFPTINGIQMKSGSIGGVVSYAGIIKNKKGEEYTFAFIVNNYNGSGNAVRKKMWQLLDVLK
jgi:D-alanyl-D-alanine carboxypeptidase/D-alanyl-D-alanine-endopeptidase (penicillin-binding protein 4)